jgi:hypothetical protein
MDRSKFLYTSHFCEENVAKMAHALSIKRGRGDGNIDYFVVFISSRSKHTPIWRQRASDDIDTPVVWDYHVVLVAKGDTSLIREHGHSLLLDLDTDLAEFPLHAGMYCMAAFRLDRSLLPEHEQTFRVIPAADFLAHFASDRSHMLQSGMPFPPWPTIKGPLSTTTMNLHDYIAMHTSDGELIAETRPGFGNVMNRDQFCIWCNERPWV